jgi:hypothetical protein
MARDLTPPDDNGGIPIPSPDPVPVPSPVIPTPTPTPPFTPKIRLPHPVVPAKPAPVPRVRPSQPPKKTPSTPGLPDDGGKDDGGNKGDGGNNIVPNPPRPNPYADRTITVRGFGNAKLPALWGPFETGGIICYEKFLSDSRLMVLYEICWGQIDAITEITCGGVNLLTSGVATVVNQYLGTSSQAVDATMAFYESRWTSRLPGKSYIVVVYAAPTESQPPINHEQLKVRGRGRLERDARLDPTLVNRYYTTNPALIWAGVKTAKPFGERRPDSTIDWSAVTATANDCDFVRSDGSPRYIMSFRIDQAKLVTDVIEELRGHAMMSETYNAGKHQIWMDKAQAASGIVFSDAPGIDNIIDCKMRVKGINECPTRVRVNFINVANGFKPDFAEYEDPGIQLGTVRLVERTYDYYGVMTYDHAYRLCVQFYNRGKQDKEVLLEVGPEGAQVLPGVVISVTSAQQNIANRACIVTNCTPVGSRWSISTETYDASTYDDTPRTTTSYTPPANATPYDTPAAPPPVTFTQEGFDIKVSFNWISSYRFYRAQRVTVQQAGFSETLLGEATRGPLYIRNVTMGALYTVRTQILGIVAGVVSAIVAATFTPSLAQVPDPVNLTYSTVGTDFYIYWDPAITLSQNLYGAGSWSVTNGGGSVDTSKINDGVTNVAAFSGNVAADTTATFDAGIGVTKNMRGIDVFTSGATTPWGPGGGRGAVDYSDDAATWVSVSNFRQTNQTPAVLTTGMHLGWDDAGSHRYWRYRKNLSFAVAISVYELQWFETTTSLVVPDHYDIYDNVGNPYATLAASAIPTRTTPLKLTSPLNVVVRNNDGSGSSTAHAVVKSATADNTSSTGVTIGSPFVTWFAGSTGLFLANGLNSNIAISAFANQNTLNTLVDATGPTAAFSIGGFDSGYSSKTLTVINRTGQTMTIVNEDVSSIASNRILTLAGASANLGANVVLTSPGIALFEYDTSALRWILISSPYKIATDGSSNTFRLDAYGTGVLPIFRSQGGRGSLTAPAASVSGDELFSLRIAGLDSSGTPTAVRAVKVSAFVNNTVSPGVVPGQLSISTTDSAGVEAERVRVTDGGVSVNRMLTIGTAPTAAVIAGGGTGATVAVDAGSSDLAGIITITAGTTPPAFVTVRVTFSAALGTNAPPVVITPIDGGGQWDQRVTHKLVNSTPTTTRFEVLLDNNSANLLVSSTYKFAYHVIGK